MDFSDPKKELASLEDARKNALVEVRAAEAAMRSLNADSPRWQWDDAEKRLDASKAILMPIERRFIMLGFQHNWDFEAPAAPAMAMST